MTDTRPSERLDAAMSMAHRVSAGQLWQVSARDGATSPAATAVLEGWPVGTLLYGRPIIRGGVEVEAGRYAIITAIGTQMVLAITQADGDTAWSAEHSLGFDSRSWSRLVLGSTLATLTYTGNAARFAQQED